MHSTDLYQQKHAMVKVALRTVFHFSQLYTKFYTFSGRTEIMHAIELRQYSVTRLMSLWFIALYCKSCQY